MAHCYLYKYVPFDLYGGVKIITDNTIKFTHPSELNDPFDCYPSFSSDFAINIYKQYVKHFNISSNGSVLTDLEPLEDIKRIQKDIISGEFWKRVFPKVGILSLSANPLNPLMWSHYSDEHRGFVVEFIVNVYNYSRAAANNCRYLREALSSCEVYYDDNRPVISSADENEWVKKVFLNKSSHWKYECEYRSICLRDDSSEDEGNSDSLGYGIKKFRKGIVQSVIAGGRMPKEQFDFLGWQIEKLNEREDRDGSNKVKLYRVQNSTREYELYAPDHPRANLIAAKYREAYRSGKHLSSPFKFVLPGRV